MGRAGSTTSIAAKAFNWCSHLEEKITKQEKGVVIVYTVTNHEQMQTIFHKQSMNLFFIYFLDWFWRGRIKILKDIS